MVSPNSSSDIDNIIYIKSPSFVSLNNKVSNLFSKPNIKITYYNTFTKYRFKDKTNLLN